MSRSYYEWMAAKQAWHEQQNLRISSLPYPGANSIVYNRDSSNPFWERRREHARSLISSSYNLNFDIDAVSQFISDAGKVERAKEEEFLAKFLPNNTDDPITAFNTLFQSRKQLDEINNRLKNVFDKKVSTNMAPNLSAIFGSYLETELNHTIQAAMSNFNPNMTPDAMMNQFNQCFEDAVMKASEKMTQITLDNGFGLGDEWKPVNEALHAANPRARELFMGAVKNAIIGKETKKIDTLFQQIWKQQQAKASGLRKRVTYRTLIANNLHIAKQTAQIGGTVAEQALAAVANAVNGLSGGSGDIKYQMHAEGVLGNMVKTDAFMLFSEDLGLDLNTMSQQLNEMLSSSTSLDEARVIINQFTNEYKAKMDELYSVFVNAKNYTMGKSYSDYDDEKSGSFEELPQFLSDAGIPIGDAQEFLSYVYNTCQGAIYESARGQVEETTINALKAAAAKIMFDDYQTFGTGSGNNIHMYYLSGKYIPSSYIFEGMANAARGQTTAKTSASVILRDKIEDNGPDWGFEGSDADFKQALFEHWNEEYEATRAAAHWSVSFTLYMKNILSGSL